MCVCVTMWLHAERAAHTAETEGVALIFHTLTPVYLKYSPRQSIDVGVLSSLIA